LNFKIGTATSGCSDCTATTTQAACIDLTGLVTEGYMGSLPLDPSNGTAGETNYYFIKNSNDTVVVGACNPDGTAAIAITK